MTNSPMNDKPKAPRKPKAPCKPKAPRKKARRKKGEPLPEALVKFLRF